MAVVVLEGLGEDQVVVGVEEALPQGGVSTELLCLDYHQQEVGKI